MASMEEFKLGTCFFVFDHSDWHGMACMVDRIVDGVPMGLCVKRPLDRYHVKDYLLDKLDIIRCKVELDTNKPRADRVDYYDRVGLPINR